ncbi:chromosome partitioning protein ParB [Pontimonas salivibrio]|uniref:Chromosome partitioning protein ParB n=1 Tax=Pontimonas salivibrio TaxID=1159327 RepID=A0A2L2BNC9_9MICO|nr:ParB/RepB/Spo0J family partition protein [Pontimonas salivibrio]AVG23147.1 chromosome partitioning protein ParB [Pontimonas salivibrio]
MAAKRSGLGRGIGALIPAQAPESESAVDVFFGSEDSSLDAVPGLALKQIPLADITPNARQPRSEFRAEELNELTHSIREFGVLQPIVVRPRPAASAAEAPYELIMGERRLRAATAAGLATIPAVVRDTSDGDMLRDALLENLHRADLNPLEEASAYKQLLDDFGTTQQELADRIGRSRPQVTNTLRLLNLAPRVQVHVAAGVLSAGHARALLAVSEPEAQEKLAEDIISQSLTVRQVEERAGSAVGQKKPGRSSRPGGRAGQLDELAEQLGDRLNTRVKISLSRTKGQLTIDFATVADLNRILGDLGMEGFSSSPR